MFDTRPWVLPVAKTKVKFPDHVDAWTKAVKQGMKKGLPVVLDATEECPHFMDKLITHAKYSKAFPEQVSVSACPPGHRMPRGSSYFIVAVRPCHDGPPAVFYISGV